MSQFIINGPLHGKAKDLEEAVAILGQMDLETLLKVIHPYFVASLPHRVTCSGRGVSCVFALVFADMVNAGVYCSANSVRLRDPRAPEVILPESVGVLIEAYDTKQYHVFERYAE